MTGNGCISFYQSNTYELKLPSEATPTSFAIQNQIQAMCGCSLFYRRELWALKPAGFNNTKASKSVGAKGDVPKISGFVHSLHPC